jgi:hypothetical protein
MQYTSVVSLEELRQMEFRAELRQKLRERFDRWLDTLERQVEEKHLTLEQITKGIFAMRQELTSTVAEALVQGVHSSELSQETALCPRCGRRLSARGSHTRTVETMVGVVSLTRPYFYCVRCQAGFYPLDEALELSERHNQWDVQKATTGLAAEVPYELASEIFSELTGLSMSNHTMHEVVGEVTQGLTVLSVSPTKEEIAQKVVEVASGKKWRPIVVLAIDGAHVPTRPEGAKGKRSGRKKKRAKRAHWQGEWREAKGIRFYLVDGERIEHLLSWHQVQNEEGLAQSLKQVKEAGLIPEQDVRLCVIADGARWIWKRVQEVFPSAVEVLDYYHCSEHLHKMATIQYGDSPENKGEWVEATLARLFCGEVQGVIHDLGKTTPKDAQAAEEIDKLIGYLKNNRDRVDYGFASKGGYPIGSGGIESANKFICHVRLKRSGAWWYVENANQMLALRCARYNGTFEKVFENYREKIKQSHGKASCKK